MNQKISYLYQKSLLERQAVLEEEFLRKFKEGSYTLEHPLVIVNPYEINPLAALVLFKTTEEIAVTIRVYGKQKEGDIEHTFPKTATHILPILGLYPGEKNKVAISLYEGRKTEIEIETEALKAAPNVCYMRTTPAYLKDDFIFITPSLAALATAIDYHGDIRWHLNVPLVFDMKRLRNGNVLIGTERVLQLPYYMSGLYEMTLAGKIVKEYRIPGGYHHDQWEMEDGNLLVLTDNPTYETVEDIIVLIDRCSGDILKTWDLKKCITPGDGPSGGYTPKDWFHNNALWYDKNSDALILSGRHTDSIVSIDFESGKLNWIMGDHRLWSQEKKKYFFTPKKGKEFDWHYEQHGCLVTPDGDVMCFDNGHYRSKIKEEFILNKDNFSRGVRYRINRENMEIEQVWQYGKQRGQEFFSSYIGNVEYYQEDHYLVHSGGIQYYGENASEVPAAMMQNDPNVRAESITVALQHDQVMMELKTTGNFYRAKRMHIYHDFDNMPLGKGSVVGKMGKTPEFSTMIPCELANEYIPLQYQPSIIEEEDRITFKAVFERGQLVMLVLENEMESHGYYISTAKNAFSAVCCGTFIDQDARSVTLSVNKEGLHGTFQIHVIIDDKKYRTGIQITC